jgi:hypothetical protein
MASIANDARSGITTFAEYAVHELRQASEAVAGVVKEGHGMFSVFQDELHDCCSGG